MRCLSEAPQRRATQTAVAALISSAPHTDHRPIIPAPTRLAHLRETVKKHPKDSHADNKQRS